MAETDFDEIERLMKSNKATHAKLKKGLAERIIGSIMNNKAKTAIIVGILLVLGIVYFVKLLIIHYIVVPVIAILLILLIDNFSKIKNFFKNIKNARRKK